MWYVQSVCVVAQQRPIAQLVGCQVARLQLQWLLLCLMVMMRMMILMMRTLAAVAARVGDGGVERRGPRVVPDDEHEISQVSEGGPLPGTFHPRQDRQRRPCCVQLHKNK